MGLSRPGAPFGRVRECSRILVTTDQAVLKLGMGDRPLPSRHGPDVGGEVRNGDPGGFGGAYPGVVQEQQQGVVAPA